MLKILLSGVGFRELKQRLPREGDVIEQVMCSLESKRISDQAIEDYLFDYVTIVTAKHRAIRKQDYTQAAQFRDKEKHYLDLSYEWLFSDDFSNRHAYRSYARFSSDLLVEELAHYLQSNR